jgi:hypothetical protein
MTESVMTFLAKDTQARPASAGLEEYGYVWLTRPVEYRGTKIPSGTRGVIVHKHADGVGYEVEFEQPVFAVVSLAGVDLTNKA